MTTPELFTRIQLAEMLWRVQPSITENDVITKESLIAITACLDYEVLNKLTQEVIGARLIPFNAGTFQLQFN